MAKKMETKSARLLALFLALIMLGSVLVYALKGGYAPPERNIVYEAHGMDEWLGWVPAGAGQVIYATKSDNKTLLKYIDDLITANYDRYVFSKLRLSYPVEGMLVAAYSDGLLYLVDVNKTKVFFAGQKESYRGLEVKTANGIMVIPETSPFLIGTTPHVVKAVDTMISGNGSMEELISNYTSRIPGNFNVVFIFYGEAAKRIITGTNNTDYIDLYISGIRMNGSMYEKVVGVHFIESGGFVKSNVTQYYNCTNYNDGFSIAVMRDMNFTKLLNAQPKLKPIIKIKSVK